MGIFDIYNTIFGPSAPSREQQQQIQQYVNTAKAQGDDIHQDVDEAKTYEGKIKQHIENAHNYIAWAKQYIMDAEANGIPNRPEYDDVVLNKKDAESYIEEAKPALRRAAIIFRIASVFNIGSSTPDNNRQSNHELNR